MRFGSWWFWGDVCATEAYEVVISLSIGAHDGDATEVEGSIRRVQRVGTVINRLNRVLDVRESR